MAQLTRIENQLLKMQQVQSAPDAPDASAERLLARLDRLTLKRHAVLTASLAEVSYHDIATLMQCSETTVKLHLKAAMTALDIPDRSAMLVQHKGMLDAIPDDVYEKRFGISKRWYLDDPVQNPRAANLMAVLTNTKPPANQHTKDTP